MHTTAPSRQWTPTRGHPSARPRVPLLSVIALVMALLAAACGRGGEASGEDGFTLRIGMTSVTGTPQGNLGWGHEHDLFLEALRPAGVTDIEFSFFQAGTDVSSALVSGAIDVAVTGDFPALATRGSGAQTRLLGLAAINGDTWLIGRQDGPTTIEGLVGGTVTAPHGTIRHRVAYGLLHAAGLEDQIEIANVPTPESLSGLASGSIDATVVGGVTAVELEQEGYIVIDRASNHPELLSTEPTTALQEFLDAHPGFVEAWQEALVTVNQHIRQNAEAYWEYVADLEDTTAEVAAVAEPVERYNTEPFPEEGIRQLAATQQFLREQGLLESDFDIDEWIVRP